MLTNKGGMLYVGMTNDLKRRIQEHKAKAVRGYTSKFSISKLIFFEEFNHPIDALAAEKR
jgi:putative endonuclease